MPNADARAQRLRAALEEAARAAAALCQVDDPCAAARLCRVERACVECLRAAGERRTLPQLRDLVESRLAEPVSEGLLKVYLARMTTPEVGILDNDRHAHPAGYAITSSFLALFNSGNVRQGRTTD